MISIEQVIGKMRNAAGEIVRVAWDMDRVMLDGRGIATINRIPGAAVTLLPGVELTPSTADELRRVIAAVRGGIPPKRINGSLVGYEILSEDDDDD